MTSNNFVVPHCDTVRPARSDKIQHDQTNSGVLGHLTPTTIKPYFDHCTTTSSTGNYAVSATPSAVVHQVQ